MVNKTIAGIIATTILTAIAVFVFKDPYILYVGFCLIATLCGVSLIKNSNKKP